MKACYVSAANTGSMEAVASSESKAALYALGCSQAVTIKSVNHDRGVMLTHMQRAIDSLAFIETPFFGRLLRLLFFECLWQPEVKMAATWAGHFFGVGETVDRVAKNRI